jgi:hypothetical protein
MSITVGRYFGAIHDSYYTRKGRYEIKEKGGRKMYPKSIKEMKRKEIL